MGRPRVLLAWEGGAGRGHIVNLRRVAESLGTACDFDAGLRDLTYSAEIEPLCSLVFQGGSLGYKVANREGPDAVPTATLGEYYSDVGLRAPDRLRENVSWWLETFKVRAIDIVIAEYAPQALMAARIAGLPALLTGTGYGAPPAALKRFPVLIPGVDKLLHSETETVEIINGALGPLGLPQLNRLAEVFTRSGDLIFSFSLLDPYAADRSSPTLSPVDSDVPEAAGGDEIFGYFSTTEFENPAIVEALLKCPFPVRIYAPSASEELKARLRASGVIVENAAISAHLIAKRSRMMINGAQPGIVSTGMAIGLPQLGIPQHIEQLYHAKCGESAGVMRHIHRDTPRYQDILSAIDNVYNDNDRQDNARRLRDALIPEFNVDQRRVIQQRLVDAVMDHRR